MWPRLWYRWRLTWSPDSSQICSIINIEGIHGNSGFRSQIMIYEWLIDETFMFAQRPDYLDEIGWLREGISVGLMVYNAFVAEMIAQHYLNDRMTFGHPLTYQGVEYAIVDSADVIPHNGRVYLMDLLTGEYGVVDGYESPSISATAQEESLVFIKDDNDTRPSFVIDPQTRRYLHPTPGKRPTWSILLFRRWSAVRLYSVGYQR